MCAVMNIGGFRCHPRIGHMYRLKRIFGFLKQYKSCSIKFRTEEPDYSKCKSKDMNWKYVYGDV